jgi:acyl carrier protein
MTLEQAIRAFLLEKVQAASAQRGLCQVPVTEDTSLLDAGAIGSMELLYLIAQIEQSFSIDLDFSDVAPEDFMTVRRLAAICAKDRKRP